MEFAIGLVIFGAAFAVGLHATPNYTLKGGWYFLWMLLTCAAIAIFGNVMFLQLIAGIVAMIAICTLQGALVRWRLVDLNMSPAVGWCTLIPFVWIVFAFNIKTKGQNNDQKTV